MYKEVFKFNARPFTSAPYVKHYFANESMNQTLTQARNCIDRSAGPVVVVGGPGSGKSLLLGMLEEQYQSQFSVANLTCVRLDKREDLLKSILFTLDQPHQGMSEGDLRFSLIDYLKPSGRCPNGVLLLVDDAQTLDFGLLDEIRLITNFVRDGQARVRLVLAGSQTLEENLAAPKLQSLNQRIAARCYLTSMRREETARYVVEHINRVGGDGEQLFDSESLKAVHEVSDGCPRLVNQVCEHALIVAATRGAAQISENHVREAWCDVQGIPGDWSAPENSQQDTSALQNDDGWTVIEFGQLEDSDESEESGTVYDFENSDGESSDVDHTPTEEPEAEPVSQTVPEPEPQLEQAAPEPVRIIQAVVPTPPTPEIESSFAEHSDTQEPENQPVEEPTLEQPDEATAELQQPEPVADSSDFATVPSHAPTVEEIAAANGVQLRQPVETVDPFEESFDEEEQLIDRFAPIVAHQNHSSLDVTSEDLEAIRPSQDSVSPQLQVARPESTDELISEHRANSLPPVSPTVQVIGLTDRPEPTPQQPVVESVLEDLTEPAVAPQPTPEAQPSPAAEPEAVTTTPPSQKPDRDTVVENAEEIEREAEAILERLRLSTVSHETVETEIEAPTSTDNLAAEQQFRELDESQKVLEEILNQKTLLSAARNQPGVSDEPAQSRLNDSINIDYPAAPPASESQPKRDDSEMLIVNRMEQKTESPKSNEPEPIPFPETPVSKGRAQRMDYQQLFDQLRDISNEQV